MSKCTKNLTTCHRRGPDGADNQPQWNFCTSTNKTRTRTFPRTHIHTHVPTAAATTAPPQEICTSITSERASEPPSPAPTSAPTPPTPTPQYTLCSAQQGRPRRSGSTRPCVVAESGGQQQAVAQAVQRDSELPPPRGNKRGDGGGVAAPSTHAQARTHARAHQPANTLLQRATCKRTGAGVLVVLRGVETDRGHHADVERGDLRPRGAASRQRRHGHEDLHLLDCDLAKVVPVCVVCFVCGCCF